MTNSEQTPNLGVTPDNHEWLAETFGQEPSEFLEHDWGELTLSLVRAIEFAVRAVPNDIASVPPNRNPEVGRITRLVSENVDLDISRLGLHALRGGEALLNRIGLSSERLALAYAALNMLHEAGGSAQFERTTIRQVVRRHTQAWHDQGWTPRPSARASCAVAAVSRPRARGGRPTRARALARSSSRGGDSGDSGEPSPSDLAGPCRCEQCGNELLRPARLCGLCEEEAGVRRETRACVVCGTDISDRRADAETCGAAHKKTLQRRRAQLREPVRLAPQQLDHDGSNPLAGVHRFVFECLYGNRGLDGTASVVVDVKAGVAEDGAGAEDNVVSIWSLRLPRDLPDFTVAGLLGLPMPTEIPVAA
jgi:hypothetical protein